VDEVVTRLKWRRESEGGESGWKDCVWAVLTGPQVPPQSQGGIVSRGLMGGVKLGLFGTTSGT